VNLAQNTHQEEEAPVQHFTTIIPSMKELEQWMLREMQEAFADPIARLPLSS